MNPSDEAPESYTNGQTNQVRPQSSLQPAKPKARPKKGFCKSFILLIIS